MDEPARRVLHRFKHGESVHSYRSKSGFNFITLLRTKSAQIRAKIVYGVDGRYGKILDFRIGPEIGLIRCSKGDKNTNSSRCASLSEGIIAGNAIMVHALPVHTCTCTNFDVYNKLVYVLARLQSCYMYWLAVNCHLTYPVYRMCRPHNLRCSCTYTTSLMTRCTFHHFDMDWRCSHLFI